MHTDQLKQALSLSFFDKYIGYTLRFISTVILARLISPHDLGIFSVAFVLITLGQMLRDFGVTQYIIQEQDLDKAKIRAAFTVMLTISWGLWAIVYTGRHWIAYFYDEKQLVEAVTTLSWIFLLIPFGSIHLSLLRREFNFKRLTWINIVSYVVLHVTTLLLAFYDYGYMALVFGQVAGVIATVMGSIVTGGYKEWYWPSFHQLKPVFHFGIQIGTSNIAESASDGANDLILGKLLNMTSVGLFSKAFSAVNLFKAAVGGAIHPVILPYFSVRRREGHEVLPEYLKGAQLYTIFAIPFFLSLALCAEPIVQVLLGDMWFGVVPLLQILSIMALLESLFPFRSSALIACQQVRWNMILQLLMSALRLFALFIGAMYGLMEAALGLVFAELITFIFTCWLFRKCFSLNFYSYFSAVYPSFVVGSLVAVGLWFIQDKWNAYHVGQVDLPIALLLMLMFSGFLIWLLGLKLVRHPVLSHMVWPKRIFHA